MKKLLYLLLLLPLAFAVSSCGDDDDKIPDVTIRTTVSGAVMKDNVIYVVQGETLGVQVTMINHSGEDGQMGVITFFMDHYNIGQALSPEVFEIETATMPLGIHLLQAQMPVYVVDYPICWGYFDYPVKVVASADELPEVPDEPVITGSVTIKND